MKRPRYPLLYQINTRVWLTELSRKLGRAATLTFLSPGLRFFHQGQFEGRRKRISPHLCRAPDEPADERIARFYERLLSVLRAPAFRDGAWRLLECAPGWDGNRSSDSFVAFVWENAADRFVVAVNFAPHASQCHVRLPFGDLAGARWQLQDQFRDTTYDWNGDDLVGRGLYLDEPSWRARVFKLARVA